MPAFPCVACKSLVDTNDVVCRKCNDKQPFECSKCSVRLAAQEIFEVDKLTFKKSLFCHKCGQENEVVRCAHCNTSIIRSVGRKRTGSNGDELVYHDECFAMYEKRARISRMVLMAGTPTLALLLFVVGAYSTRNLEAGAKMAGVGAVAVIILGLITRPPGLTQTLKQPPKTKKPPGCPDGFFVQDGLK